MSFEIAIATRFAAVVASVLAAPEKATAVEGVALAIDALAKGGEAAKGWKPLQSEPLKATLEAVAGRLKAGCDEWLARNGGEDPEGSVAVAFANFPEVAASCLPAREALAQLGHDPERIAAAVYAAAEARRMDVFARGKPRELLTVWIASTYRALLAQPKFVETLAGVNWAEMFARQERVEGKVDAGFGDVEAAAERRHRELVAANEAIREEIAREKGVNPEVLQPLFEHLGVLELTTAQMRTQAHEAVAAILAKANEAPAQSNLGRDIDAIIAAARERLRALDTAGAIRLLDGPIEAEEAAVLRLTRLLKEKATVQWLAFDREGAKATLRRLLALDRDQAWAWAELGDIAERQGAVAEALAAFRKAQEVALGNGNERNISASHIRIGDMLARQGQLGNALVAYHASHDVYEHLVHADSGHNRAQRGLRISFNRIGDILARQGRTGDALVAYRAGFENAERVALANPSDARAQRDLSIAQNKIGDMLLRQGRLRA